jgi:transaldolase
MDDLTRQMMLSGELGKRISQGIRGITSNPTIFAKAFNEGAAPYAFDIANDVAKGWSAQEIYEDLVATDARNACDLMRDVYEQSGGADGFVSLEVSPHLAHDAEGSLAEARRFWARVDRSNLFIKIPGTAAGVAAIEASIFAGVPINVTLLFSREHYVAAAEAYLRGIERRLAAGRDPKVESVASLFVSRWDVAVKDRVAATQRNRLGIAIARRPDKAYREMLASKRWQKLAAAGARPQRLLWASTGTKDPEASDTLYVEALAAPETIDTMPDKTLQAFAEHGKVEAVMPLDGGDAEQVVAEFRRQCIDDTALAERLQREGAEAFSKSWHRLLAGIDAKTSGLAGAGAR